MKLEILNQKVNKPQLMNPHHIFHRQHLLAPSSLCGLQSFFHRASLGEVVLCSSCCDPALCEFNQSKTLGPQPLEMSLKMKNNEFLIAFCQ